MCGEGRYSWVYSWGLKGASPLVCAGKAGIAGCISTWGLNGASPLVGAGKAGSWAGR